MFDLLLNTKLSSPLQGMGYIRPEAGTARWALLNSLAANWLQKLVKIDTSSRVHGVTRDTPGRGLAVFREKARSRTFPGGRGVWKEVAGAIWTPARPSWTRHCHGPRADWVAWVTVAKATVAPQSLARPKLKVDRQPNELK